MPVSDHELAQAVALIAHDLAATLDWDPQRAATFAEETIGVGVNVHDWDVAWGSYAIRGAEDGQQQPHDTFVHTTWPACPLHLQHPLWLDRDHNRAVWRCTRAGIDIAPLGSLTGSTCASRLTRPARWSDAPPGVGPVAT